MPLVLIAGAALGYVAFISGGKNSGEGQGSGNGANEPPPQPLVHGQDYYVVVRTIELYPTRPNGKAWDRLDDSGPDISFDLQWQDNTVFEGDTKQDTLIGSWEAISLDLKQAILKQKIDLSSAIDAAIIRIEKDTEVIVKVSDNDLPGSDEAGNVKLRLGKMKLGDNTANYKFSETNAVKRMVVRIIDKSLPVAQLVEQATQP